jgi:MFS family permease
MGKSSRSALVIGSLVFFALGLLMAQIGPVLAELSTRATTTLAAIGAIFTALFLGALLTQLTGGLVCDRVGERPVLLVGLGLACAGMLGIAFSRTLPLMLAWAFVAGLGNGCLTVSTNLMVARTFAERSVSALNLANVFFGVGSMAGPALASLALLYMGTGLPGLWLGVGGASTKRRVPAYRPPGDPGS